jgi:Cu-Zn family superoxide dismutase
MMKHLFVLFSVISIILLVSCGPDPSNEPAILAVATLYRTTNVTDSTYSVSSEEIGAATFSERNGVVTVSINAINLTPSNRHAIHIHEGTCEEPGSHWNQGTQASFCREMNLGEAWAKPYAGDVGNLRANDQGAGTFELSTEFWRLGSGDNFDITGKLVIVHAEEEDFAQECFQSHNHMHDNAKIACGTIELVTND